MCASLLDIVKAETCKSVFTHLKTHSSINFEEIGSYFRFEFCRTETIKRACGVHFPEEVCVSHLFIANSSVLTIHDGLLYLKNKH